MRNKICTISMFRKKEKEKEKEKNERKGKKMKWPNGAFAIYQPLNLLWYNINHCLITILNLNLMEGQFRLFMYTRSAPNNMLNKSEGSE